MRKCCICKIKRPKPQDFIRMGNKLVCSSECGDKLIKLALEKARKKAIRDYDAETRRRRREMESISDVAKKLAAACNFLVRQRDWYKPCITCGKPIDKSGTNYHAGHFIPYGTKYKFSPLRFDLRNVNGQCLHCNAFNSGRPREYESGLIARYDKEYVEGIKETKHQIDCGEIPNFTKQEMRDLAKHYRAEGRKYEKRNKN